MKLLLLGGPRFLGYAIIESALAHNHEITLFNRGKTAPDLFPELEKLTGDRDGGLSALDGRRWDAVIDTCGYFPRIVRASANKLRDAVEHYTFISSISVYQDPLQPPYDETIPVRTLEDESVEEITGSTYGPLKVLCENAVEEELPGRALIVRPGLIVGPRDPSDRFTYWPDRIARGGRVLAPGSPMDPCQLIDVRDLADWLVRMAETRKTGVFNATGPVTPISDVLAACVPPGVTAYFEWIPEEFLLENGAEPWMEIPLWLPGEAKSTLRVSIDRAISQGLRFRPVKETARDVLAWSMTRPATYEWHAGLAPQKEAELLALWDRSRNG